MSEEAHNVTNLDDEEKQRPGRRKALACYQCRDRKIGVRTSLTNTRARTFTDHLDKCDKLYPCTNCCNRRKSEPCRYSPEAQASAFTQAQEIGRLRKQLRSSTELNRTLQTTLDDRYGENDTTCQCTRAPFMPLGRPECSSPAAGKTSMENRESIYFGAPSCAEVIEEVCH